MELFGDFHNPPFNDHPMPTATSIRHRSGPFHVQFRSTCAMKSLLFRSILLVAVFYFGANAQAETTGWSWGPLTSSTTDKGSYSWLPQWKAPDVVGSVKKATHSVTSTTKRATNAVTQTTSNAWNSATRTTKKAWNKTTEILAPFPKDTTTASRSSSSGSSSWFGGSNKIEKPATVQEFLRQERP